jgi:predicted membrane chloride channel (bestrophin family)
MHACMHTCIIMQKKQGLWQGIFELERSVWCAVLPYCVLNCTIMVGVEILALYGDMKIAFSPAGHGLMALIVSFLVISKVNLTYDRYMQCRHATGHALAALRELHQTALTFTATRRRPCSRAAMAWRAKVTAKVIDLLDCTIRVIKVCMFVCFLFFFRRRLRCLSSL